MAEGFPGVERLPSGRYRPRPVNPVTGKRERGKGTFATAEEAYAAKKRQEQSLDDAYRSQGFEVRRQTRTPDAHITVPELVWAWIAEWRPASDQSVETAHCAARRIEKVFGGMEAAKLDREAIERWLRDEKDAGYAFNTRASRLSFLRRSLDRAVRLHLLAVNAAADVSIKERAPKRRTKGRLVEDHEFRLLVSLMPQHLSATLYLARDAGMRLSEVCGLRWSSVDLNPRRGEMPAVVVADTINKKGTRRPVTKNGGTRRVPLSDAAADALRVHRELFPPNAPGDRVFRTPQSPRHAANDHVPQATLQRAWTKARKEAGLYQPWPRFHDLRHGTGTQLMRAGVPIEDARIIMGHGDYRTLQIYVAESPSERLDNAVRRAWNG